MRPAGPRAAAAAGRQSGIAAAITLRAPRTSRSGWHERGVLVSVKRRSPNSPRARRSAIGRSVSAYGSAGATPSSRPSTASSSCIGTSVIRSVPCAPSGSTRRAARRSCSWIATCRCRSQGRARRACACAPARSTTSTSGSGSASRRAPSRTRSAPTARASSTPLGPGTEGPEPGTEVVINPGLFCGVCEACLRGQQSLCERFAVLGEHVAGRARRLLRRARAQPPREARAAELRRGGRVSARVRDRLAHADDARPPAARRVGARVGRRLGRRQRRRRRSPRRSARA